MLDPSIAAVCTTGHVSPICSVLRSITNVNSFIRTSLSAFGLVFEVFWVVRATWHEKDPQNNKEFRKWVVRIKLFTVTALIE